MVSTKKIGQWDVLVLHDRSDNSYTIAYKGEGGAIVTSTIYEEAEKKFIEMMEIAEGAAILLNAEEALKASENKKNERIQKQINWVQSNIKLAIESGKTSCMREDEALYDETIKHFSDKGYDIKNGYSSDSFLSNFGHRFMEASMDNSFHYWRVSWAQS